MQITMLVFFFRLCFCSYFVVTNSIYDEDGDRSNHVSCKVIIMNINTVRRRKRRSLVYYIVLYTIDTTDGDGSDHVSCKVIKMNINTKKKTQNAGVLYCLVFEDDAFVCVEPYYTC